jgi:hypothetical protein
MLDEPDYVPLLDVLQEVRRRRSVDDRAAQDVIREAHCLGDIELRIRRPAGSFEDLGRGVWQMDPWHGETWRQLFDRGVIQAEFRVRRSRRRVGALEPCRIYGTRKSLDRFLGIPQPMAKSPGPTPGEVRHYDESDRALFDEVERLMAEQKLTRTAATEKLANDGRIAGTGAPQSRAKRLARLYKKEREGK